MSYKIRSCNFIQIQKSLEEKIQNLAWIWKVVINKIQRNEYGKFYICINTYYLYTYMYLHIQINIYTHVTYITLHIYCIKIILRTWNDRWQGENICKSFVSSEKTCTQKILKNNIIIRKIIQILKKEIFKKKIQQRFMSDH